MKRTACFSLSVILVATISAAPENSSDTAPYKVLNVSFPVASPLPKNGSVSLRPLFAAYSDKTPVFSNDSLIRTLSSRSGGAIQKRAVVDLPDGLCAPGIPCRNGACCSNSGVCSYAPSSCDAKYCISNCEAKAPCGEYAAAGNSTCPLNVCCSQYGFCGTLDDFCGKGCQVGYGGCGPPPTPSCSGGSANTIRIGYYESWAATRKCDKRSPEEIDLSGFTHLNFAFAYFDPKSFQISPMDANSASLYHRFTALKSKKPGLQTWISIGGWTFNDESNTPNTRTAFSDMASSARNRYTFIKSLQSFMQTYGFDGVDLDWEYPAADDRGGKQADFSNFARLIAEMRQTFGAGYGITLTLPSSLWYLRHFDVLSLEPYVDWFNFMSYDIHGTWDSTNKYTGPFIRPHTNLTEVKDGLSLLWRAGVKPEKVVLGIGWYGRSFTLTDPSCKIPNGVCRFTEGAAPGQCTDTSGVLSNAEIQRIRDKGGAVEQYDAEAAVKWMTWNSNQWVSYDDGVTTQQKIQAANSLCLGGIMVWAVDQDNTDGDSMSDLLGVGTANGVSRDKARALKKQLADAQLQHDIAASCYWTLCGKTCEHGYFDVTEAKGQVANVQQNSVCSGGQLQTLCCAPGTTMGKCSWEGFRGLGLPCTPVCNDTTALVVARNSNSYQTNAGGQLADLTCTGGFQAFCCKGFIPSSITNTGNMFLYGQGIFKRNLGLVGIGPGSEPRSTTPRRPGKDNLPSAVGVMTTTMCVAAITAMIAAAPFTFGLSLLGIAAEVALCAAAGILVSAAGYAIQSATPSQPPPKPPPPVAQPRTGVPTTITKGRSVRSKYGQWNIMDFGTVAQETSCDCLITYTCRYNMGWDEVCDNQRWAIDKLLGGLKVYHYAGGGRAVDRKQAEWAGNQRNAEFRTLVQGKRMPKPAQCQVDEFPLGSMQESEHSGPQACRLVNGKANGAQGNDWANWLRAVYSRCSIFRRDVCHSPDPPPVTWEFDPTMPYPGNRGIAAGRHFLVAYGFDSQTPDSLCFASYTYTGADDKVSGTMVQDHGFRALDDDPMFGYPFQWPRQNWKVKPAPKANAGQRPREIDATPYVKRDVPDEHFNSTSPQPGTATSPPVCYANTRDAPPSNTEAPQPDGGPVTLDSLAFEDMYGNPVAREACDEVFDAHGHQLRVLVAEDGRVVIDYADHAGRFWGERPESPVTAAGAGAGTQAAASSSATAKAVARARGWGDPEAARPLPARGGGAVPTQTEGRGIRGRSIITVAPRLRRGRREVEEE